MTVPQNDLSDSVVHGSRQNYTVLSCNNVRRFRTRRQDAPETTTGHQVIGCKIFTAKIVPKRLANLARAGPVDSGHERQLVMTSAEFIETNKVS